MIVKNQPVVKLLRHYKYRSSVLLEDGSKLLVTNIYNSKDSETLFWEKSRPKLTRFGVELECLAKSVNHLDKLLSKLNSLGLEVDVDLEKEHIPDYTKWRLVRDLSVKPNKYSKNYRGECTIELISPVLDINLASFKLLRTVLSVLKENHFYTNTTCATHFHMSFDQSVHNKNIPVRDATLTTRLFEIYSFWEEALDTLQPKTRREDSNSYCHTLKNLKPWMLTDRYRKIQVCSLKTTGTIECRHQAGTLNYNKIYNFMLLVKAVIETGLAKPLPVIPEGYRDINRLLQWLPEEVLFNKDYILQRSKSFLFS